MSAFVRAGDGPTIIVGLFVAVMLGLNLWLNNPSEKYRQAAIRRGCAIYNPESGEFQWAALEATAATRWEFVIPEVPKSEVDK